MIGPLELGSTVLDQYEIDVQPPAFFTGRESF
jgi:hypothetical protein